jgi:methyltransferase (TIGR00027 family)
MRDMFKHSNGVASITAQHVVSEPGGSLNIRAFMTARSRFAEDELTAAITRGATQFVVLCAGLDSHAYRNSHSGLRVFEVDHPATQAWKRNQLDDAGIAVPSWLTFVPTDFERQSLSSALENSGFQTGEISFFSWLGVTPYLTAEAALATLAFIGSLPAGSGVVFDYAEERSSLDAVEQMAMDALASRVARGGEPFRLFLDPRALNRMLKNAGFHEVEDLGPVAGLAHLVNARV